MKHINDTHSENVGHKIVYFDPPTKQIKITKSLVWNAQYIISSPLHSCLSYSKEKCFFFMLTFMATLLLF